MIKQEIKVLVSPLIKVYKANTTSASNIIISENKMLQLLTNTTVCLEQIGTLFRSQVQMGRISLGKTSTGAQNERFYRVDENDNYRLSDDRETICDFVNITQNLVHNLERWIAANIGIGGSNLKTDEPELISKSQKCDNCHSTLQSIKLKSLKDELLSKPGINYSFQTNAHNQNSLDQDEDKNFLDSNFWSGFTRQEYEREKNNLYPKADAYLIHWLAQQKLKQSKFNQITLSTETGQKHERVDGYMIDELIDTMLRILRKHMGKKHMVWKMKQFADIITKVYQEKKIEDECKNEEKKNEEAAFSQSKCTCNCEKHSIQVVHYQQKQRKEKNRGSKLNSKEPTPLKSKSKEQPRKDSAQSKKNEKNEAKVSDQEIEDEEQYADYVDIQQNFRAPSKNSQRQSVIFKERKENPSSKRFSVVGKVGLGFRERRTKVLTVQKQNSSSEQKCEEVEIMSKDKSGFSKKKSSFQDESYPSVVMQQKETQCSLIDHKQFEELLQKKKELIKAISQAKSNHQEIKNHRSLLKNSYEGTKMKTEPKHNNSILQNAQDENMKTELNINHSSKNLLSLQKIQKISTRSSKVFQTKIKVKNNRVSLLNKSVEQNRCFTIPGLEQTPVKVKQSNGISVHLSNLKQNHQPNKDTSISQNVQKSLEAMYRHKSVKTQKITEKPKQEHLKSAHKSYKPAQAKTQSTEPLYKTQTFKVSTSNSINKHYKQFGDKVQNLMKKIQNKSSHEANKKATKYLNKEIVVKNIDQKTKVQINQKLFNLDDLELFGGVSESSNFLKNLQNFKQNKVPTQQNDNVEQFCIKLLKHIEYLHDYNGHIFENVVSFICNPYKTVQMQKIISTKTDMNKMAIIIRTLLKWHQKMCGNCLCFHVQSFMTKILYFRKETDL